MPLATPPVRYDLIRLAGGLDQVTPTLALPPGVARRSTNFECSVTGGYTRIAGYERFDGRPSPSAARYNALVCTLTGSVAVGNTVVGATSTATGKVIAIDGGTLIITRETGTFADGENITVSAVTVGSVVTVLGIVADGLQDATYRALAADDYRADIQAVPGSGAILGVAVYLGTVYAWRNNAGNTAADMYKSTGSGWTQVTLGRELTFATGTAIILDGQTVTGGTSGATGVVARVVLESGTWAGGDAAGRLILSSTTGTFTNGENLTVSAAVKAVAGGAATQITLDKDGRYETVVANFGGGTANYRLYGCDGKNRAFEFDGTTFVPINTGMAVDKPEHIAFHKQHLFLSFGASVQFSSLGDPYQWSPLLGAGEIAMNAQVTNIIPLPGDQSSGALGVYTRRDTSVLYGTDAGSFALSTFNSGTGAMAYTAQTMDQCYVLDDRGVMGLGTSLNFGNFVPASLTMVLRPFIEPRINLAVGSTVNREKGQYRIFFSDFNALYVTIVNGQYKGSMPVQFAHRVACCVEAEGADGSAVSFFGSGNGFVYQMDRGTSFDGAAIPSSFTLVYSSAGGPRLIKRYRKGSVELTGDSYAQLNFGFDMGYRSQALSQPNDLTYPADLRSAFWDNFEWDNFVWDGADLTPTEVEMTGSAENVAVRISSVSAIFEPFTVNSVIVHYTTRRGIR